MQQAAEQSTSRSDPSGEAWVVDLDGVIWLAGEPISGSALAVARLRQRGVRIVFATNNAAPTVADLVSRLRRAGLEAQPGDVVTSAQAAASLLAPGSRVFPCAEGGVVAALTERGISVVDDGPCDAVVVGLTRRFDFDLLHRAATLVRQGARFIGTNEDATYPTPDGLLPGAGALLAAVATAAEATAEVAGKPHQPMADLIRHRVPHVSLVVGDRPSTDGALARRLGVPFALVRSGVTGDGGEPLAVRPDHDAPDLGALVTRIVP
ncbi:MAG TPA: HAD-IIA family hydrolase [Acidimicrobiales bacterium]|nr:HAD-IIA family hydrolase [Acidimicrobiales bacterium]